MYVIPHTIKFHRLKKVERQIVRAMPVWLGRLTAKGLIHNSGWTSRSYLDICTIAWARLVK